MRSDGTDARQVGWGLCPALSPAGDRIAYRNGGDLGIVNLDGSNDRPLTTGRNVVRPLWSPDGTQLLTAENGDIVVVNAADGRVRTITSGTATDFLPSWSPDGRFIAFASLHNQHYGIFVIKPTAIICVRYRPHWTAIAHSGRGSRQPSITDRCPRSYGVASCMNNGTGTTGIPRLIQ